VGRLYEIDPQTVFVVQFFSADSTTKYVIEEGTGRWFLDGEDPQPVDPRAWAESLLLLSNPRIEQIIARDIDDPSLYGLDPPETAVVIVRQGGLRSIEFHIGDVTPDGEHRYVSVILGSVITQDTNLYGVLSSRIDKIVALATDPVLEGAASNTPQG
jgi:hypothetical protein